MTLAEINAMLLEALHLTLPYVEGELESPCYKRGAVAKDVKVLREAIEIAETFNNPHTWNE